MRAFLSGVRTLHLSQANRRDETASGLQTGWHLWERATQEAERLGRGIKILDLGSGYSSLVLRHWLQQQQRTGWSRGHEVWTTDTEWRWLGATMFELELNGLDTAHCHHQALFEQLSPERIWDQFDLVFVDLDRLAERVRRAADISLWARPGALLILDDWHHQGYTVDMTAMLRGLGGFTVPEPIPTTMDHHGRYVAEVRRL